MSSVIREEFRVNKFGFQHGNPEDFFNSQWRWPRLVYVFYRTIMAAYAIFAFIHTVVIVEELYIQAINTSNDDTDNQARRYHSMAYLTLWTYSLFIFHLVLALFITAACFKQPEKPLKSDSKQDLGPDKFPWYSKISWVLSNIVSDFAIIVTSVYFIAVFKPSDGISLSDVNVHVLNTVFVVVDNFISARPYRILHVIYSIIYGGVYVIFSVIFWAVDHKNVIYQGVLDWNNPGFTIGVVAGLMFIIIVVHIVNFGMYRLRLFIYWKMFGR